MNSPRESTGLIVIFRGEPRLHCVPAEAYDFLLAFLLDSLVKLPFVVGSSGEERPIPLLTLNEILGDRNYDWGVHCFCDLHRVLAHTELLIIKARNNTAHRPLDPNGPSLLAALIIKGLGMRPSDAEQFVAVLIE